MKEAYPVLLTKTKDTKNTILVEVPDLNIQTEGYGIADAIEMARDAIGLEIITREDEGIGKCDAGSMGRLCVGFGGNFGSHRFNQQCN